MKYQKTVKCKLFITKSGMWVEIGEKIRNQKFFFASNFHRFVGFMDLLLLEC